MALDDDRAKAMVQLLFIHRLLLLQLFAFLCKFLVLLYSILYVLAIFAPAVEERAGSFTLVSFGCHVAIIALCSFLTVPWVGLQFPGLT